MSVSPEGSPLSAAGPLMNQLLGGYRITQMIYTAAKLGVAETLAGGPLSGEELAAKVGAHPRSLYRLLRALAGLGVFAEDETGRFALNPLAELLRADAPGSLKPFILAEGETWWWASWGNLLHSVKTGQPAFDHVHGQGFFPSSNKILKQPQLSIIS